MKKIKIFKYINFISLSIASLAAITSPLILKNTNSDNNPFFNSNQRNSFSSGRALTNNTNDITTTTNNIIKPNMGSSNKIDFENAPLQYYASDEIYFSGYALLTSSTTTGNKYDQISKFNSSGTNTGKVDWIVKKTDLGALINTSIQESELEIRSISFAAGNQLETNNPSVLNVLLHSTNTTHKGSWVFKIIWDGVDKGKYKMIKKLSGNVDSWNYLLSSSKEILALSFPKFTSAKDTNISYELVNKNFSKEHTIIMPSEGTNKFDTTSTIINSFIYNNNLYAVYQAKNTTNSINKLLTIFSFPLSLIQETTPSTAPSIILNNIYSFDLTSLFTKKSTEFKIDNNFLSSHIIHKNAGNYSIVLSNGETPSAAQTSSSYSYIDFDLLNLFGSSPSISISSQSFSYTSSMESSYLVNIRKLYKSGSRNNYGYVSITSNNLAIELDQNFKYVKTLYNFSIATPSLGTINNIYTKPTDSNWYAQMIDTTFGQMNSSTLVGQWDKIASSTSSLELPAIVDVKNSNEILNGLLFTQVANSANNDYSDQFKSAITNNNNAYKSFLNVTFVDPRLVRNQPSIKIEASTFTIGNNKIYPITLTFKQTLRNLDKNGNIVSGNTTELIIAKASFNFINQDGSIVASNNSSSGFNIPSYIKNSLPSTITSTIALQHLFKMQNVLNPQLILKPDDLNGSLNIEITVPYIWVNGVLKFNSIFIFNFGDNSNPYFSSNPLSNQDTSVVLYDTQYLDDNPTIKNNLSIKYSATSPSNISKKDAINDFVKFGGAFSNPNNDRYISKLQESDITLTPLNTTGQLYIEFTFSKIGNNTNVTYSFQTGSVFLTNPAANDAIFFNFKPESVVLDTVVNVVTDQKYRDYAPSQLISDLINTSDTAKQLSTLKNYASFSHYFDSIIGQSQNGEALMTITTEVNDPAGLLTVIITLLNPLPNTNINVIQKTFSGFRKSGTIIGQQSTFTFGDMPSSILNSAASNTNEEELIRNNVLQITGNTVNLQREVKLVPVNESGILSVTVIFYNWIDVSNNGVITISPIKEFSRIYTGFPIVKAPVYSLIWKSFDELNNTYKSLTPSTFINTISQLGNAYNQLKAVSSLSDVLDSYLINNTDKIEISYSPNDQNGSVNINLKIIGIENKNSVNTFSTTISGFIASSLIPNIIWTNNSDSTLQSIKDKLPSQLSSSEIGLLYSTVDASSYKTDILVKTDDTKGTIILEITLTSETGQSYNYTNAFSNFKINAPIYKGTNWYFIIFVVCSVFVIFAIPCFIIGLYRMKISRKKIIKKLDKRLDEKYKSDKTTKTYSSIEDLIE